MPELDTLRGCAVFLVLLVHGFVFPYGYAGYSGSARWFMKATSFGKVGVNLFFVLSGFLITGILIRSKSDPGFFRNFYARRALRILPVYFLTLIWLLVMGAPWRFVILSALFMANVTTLFGVAMFFGPLWSLAVEEHFYLLWPAIVKRLTVFNVAVLAGLICLFTPLLRAFFFRSSGLSQFTWFNCDGLAAGALIQIFMTRLANRRLIAFLGTLLIVAPIVITKLVGVDNILDQSTPIGAGLQLPLWNLLFAGVLVNFLLLGSSPYSAWVTWRPIQFVGEISYGLYLFHLLVFVQVNRLFSHFIPRLAEPNPPLTLLIPVFMCGATIAVGLAWLSRTYFEEWFLRKKARFQSKKASVAIA